MVQEADRGWRDRFGLVELREAMASGNRAGAKGIFGTEPIALHVSILIEVGLF